MSGTEFPLHGEVTEETSVTNETEVTPVASTEPEPEAEVVAAEPEPVAEEYVDPWDVEPTPPVPAANDADRPRWVRENVAYLEKLGQHRSWQALKATHPHEASRQAKARKDYAGQP